MADLLHLQSTFLLLSLFHTATSASRQCRASRVEAKVREIFMPALSSTMTEGKIVSWTTAQGDPLVVIESDKADMDIKTFHDGFLAAALVPAGESTPVSSAIALLIESEEEIPLAQSQAASSPRPLHRVLAKATSMALVQYPVVSAICRDGKSSTYNSSINIAVARGGKR